MSETAPSLLPFAAGERKPLYLDPKTSARVELEGPSLTLLVAGQAPRYLPLRRISRILANERAEFSTPALLACAQQGISLLFVDRDGETRARLLGAPGERQELRQRLVDLLVRPDWRDLYATWCYAQEKRTLGRVHRRLQAPAEIHDAARLRTWLKGQAVALAGERQAARSASWLDELLFAWMLNHLQQLGLGAQSELLQDGWPDLVTDLHRLHRWYGETIRIGWLRRRALWAQRTGQPLRELTRRDLIDLYQNNSARLGGFGREITNALHRWLVELA